MDEKQPRLPKLKRPSEGRGPGFTTRIGMLWLIIVVIVIGVMLKVRQFQSDNPAEISYGLLEQKVEQGLIKSATFEDGAGALYKLKGEYLDTGKDGQTKPVKFVAKVPHSDEVLKFLKSKGVSMEFTEASQLWLAFLINAAPFVLFVALIYIFF